jgi:hypothetical protein
MNHNLDCGNVHLLHHFKGLVCEWVEEGKLWSEEFLNVLTANLRVLDHGLVPTFHFLGDVAQGAKEVRKG